MKKLTWLFVCVVSIAGLSSCDVTDANTKDSIKFVVKDFSENGVHKKITYTNGWNGTPIIVHSNDTLWIAEFKEYSPQLDSDLTVNIESDTIVKIGAYIYENGELVKSKESHQLKEFSIKYLR